MKTSLHSIKLKQ